MTWCGVVKRSLVLLRRHVREARYRRDSAMLFNAISMLGDLLADGGAFDWSGP